MKKLVPHFRMIIPYSEWGRSPEGEEGKQYSHVRDVHPVLIFEYTATSERVSNVPELQRAQQLRRGAGDCSALVLILMKYRCQGRETFAYLRQQKFSARFLDKKE